jgi:hypothetical protein
MATFKHEQDKVIARAKVEVESALTGALKMQERELGARPIFRDRELRLSEAADLRRSNGELPQ